MNDKLLPCILALLLIILILPYTFSDKDSHIILNQEYIQEQNKKYGTISLEEYKDTFMVSNYWKGMGNLFTTQRPKDFDYNNTDSVFLYVFSHLPRYAVVYPTETYYYYQIETDRINLSGNVRLLDIHEGTLHFGYFNREQPRIENQAKSYGTKEGLRVWKLKNNLYRVEYQGITRIFKLPNYEKTQPEKLTLLQGERYISNIYDESGIKFFLIFNEETNSFHYLVDERKGMSEELQVLEKGFLQGKRTNFIYYQDEEPYRKLLVGVSSYNILANNYLDGPFDQVPPRLGIKEELNVAYPYTLFYEGIDEHGNFLIPWQSGSRVAISPYRDYFTLEEFYNYTNNCEGKKERFAYYECLTYEKKRHFHQEYETLLKENDSNLSE